MNESYILYINMGSNISVFNSYSALKSINDCFPHSKIHFIFPDYLFSIISKWDFIDTFIPTEVNAGFFEKWSLFSKLKSYKYDFIFLIDNFSGEFFIKKYLNFKKFISSKNTDELLSSSFNDNGLIFRKYEPLISYPEGFSYRVGKIKPPLLTIIPFSEYTDLEWPIDKFLYIASAYNNITGGNIVIAGDNRTYERSRAFLVYNFVYNITENASPLDVSFVAKHSNAVLCSPSIFSHIASAVNKNVICVSDSDCSRFDFPASARKKFSRERDAVNRDFSEEEVLEAVINKSSE